ncbi:MAG: hypothetical protein MUO26_05435 [Methanotrichaceae archaeon]|nr:hypothetical protein [Methanotrichaceae archaeon]
MPRPEHANRQFIVYFPTEHDLERWKKLAKDAGFPLSKWIYETIEAKLAEQDSKLKDDIIRDLSKLKEDNQKLKDELRLKSLALEKCQTDLFKLRHDVFLHPQQPGIIRYSEELVELLKSGGAWSGSEIMKSLHIDPKDSDAIKIVRKQLQELQDFGLIKEEARGWRWI